MNNLTCNQLMCLLDIHRGTKTQENIGTIANDKLILLRKELIYHTPSGAFYTTVKGSLLINQILSINVL